jgi:hypothetical protein
MDAPPIKETFSSTVISPISCSILSSIPHHLCCRPALAYRGNIGEEEDVVKAPGTRTLRDPNPDKRATSCGAAPDRDAGRGKSSIVGNEAPYGGGLFSGSDLAKLVYLTVSGNRAIEDWGGGILAWGGTTSITFATIASNTAADGGGYGIHQTGGAVLAHNTIVAYNGTTSTNCTGVITSNGYNLEYGDTCGFAAANDLTDTDPLLAPLAVDRDAWVHALPQHSAAVDAGSCCAGVTANQRGVRRPQMLLCDIGAYEWEWWHLYLPLVLRSY